MCRLIAVVGMNTIARSLALYESLIYSGLEGQKDGWGITDGETTLKSGYSIAATTDLFAQVDQLNKKRPCYIGHVRAASPGTGTSSSYNSHPYVFNTPSGRQLIIAHNGFIDNTRPHHPDDQANTDTYRAAEDLALMLDTPLSKHKIQDWLDELSEKSEYSFLFIDDSKIIGVRGVRNISYMIVELNGHSMLVMNTSETVLHHLSDFFIRFSKYSGTQLKIKPIEQIPEGTYFEIEMKIGEKSYPIIKKEKIRINGYKREDLGVIRFFTTPDAARGSTGTTVEAIDENELATQYEQYIRG